MSLACSYSRMLIINFSGFEERSDFLLSFNDTREEEIEFMVSVQLTDHVLNVQDALVPVTATLTSQSGTNFTGNANVEVQVTGVETPQLIYDFSFESFAYYEKVSG